MAVTGATPAQPPPDIKTPRAKFSPLASLLSAQSFQYWAARGGARIGKWRGKPLRFGRAVVAVRYADVVEMLNRDLDFIIGPTNAQKIDDVNGHFVLGLDRSATLVDERRALYSALAAVDLGAFRKRAEERAARCEAELPARFDAIAHFARPLAAASASDIFGVGGGDLAKFAEIARAIFAHTFLNLGNDATIRQRALNAASLMKDMLANEIARRRSTGELGDDFMGQLLRQQQLDDDGVRRTIGGMLVGSVDTTTSAVAKIVCVAFGDPRLRQAIVESSNRGEDTYGWCLEALRKWPHNPILLRNAGTDTTLAGTSIRSGERVVAWTHAAMLDASAFPEPLLSIGDRDRSSYLHFGVGLHPCAGRVINAIQIPLLVERLLKRDIRRDGRMRWAGPFPDQLPVRTGKA
jgi:cytochrome P450